MGLRPTCCAISAVGNAAIAPLSRACRDRATSRTSATGGRAARRRAADALDPRVVRPPRAQRQGGARPVRVGGPDTERGGTCTRPARSDRPDTPASRPPAATRSRGRRPRRVARSGWRCRYDRERRTAVSLDLFDPPAPELSADETARRRAHLRDEIERIRAGTRPGGYRSSRLGEARRAGGTVRGSGPRLSGWRSSRRSRCCCPADSQATR